jgi:hypothetical protein
MTKLLDGVERKKEQKFDEIPFLFSFHAIKRSPIKLISFPLSKIPSSFPFRLAYVQAEASYFNVASVCAKWVEATMGVRRKGY